MMLKRWTSKYSKEKIKSLKIDSGASFLKENEKLKEGKDNEK